MNQTEALSSPGRWIASQSTNAGSGRLALQLAKGGTPADYVHERDCTVVFDGVLYNRTELDSQLDSAPAESHASLVLKCYLRWGESFVGKLRGIFALVLSDGREQKLVCARDPLGIYPLYYSVCSGELLFSTCIETLLSHPAVSRSINRAAVADHLLHRWPDIQETFYEHIKRLPPGHVLELDRSVRRIRRYWEPDPPGQPVRWVREDELARFDSLLTTATRRCLGFGAAAVYLSGGLDSVSVAAVATEQSRSLGLPAPRALSLVFPDPECNEESIQRRVANELGLPHELLSFKAAAGADGWFRSALRFCGDAPLPVLNPWAPLYVSLADRADGCPVVLTGAGGDEWLGVSPFYASDLLRRGDWKGLYRLWATQQRSYKLFPVTFTRNLVWRFGLRPLLRDAVVAGPGGTFLQSLVWSFRRRTSGKLPNWVAPDPALRNELNQRGREVGRMTQGDSHYFRELRHALDHLLPCWEMEENFENGRRLGCRILHPFLDADLVEFLYRTPPELLNQGGRSKGLVRNSLSKRFPSLGFRQQKKVLSTGFYRSILLGSTRPRTPGPE